MGEWAAAATDLGSFQPGQSTRCARARYQGTSSDWKLKFRFSSNLAAKKHRGVKTATKPAVGSLRTACRLCSTGKGTARTPPTVTLGDGQQPVRRPSALESPTATRPHRANRQTGRVQFHSSAPSTDRQRLSLHLTGRSSSPGSSNDQLIARSRSPSSGSQIGLPRACVRNAETRWRTAPPLFGMPPPQRPWPVYACVCMCLLQLGLWLRSSSSSTSNKRRFRLIRRSLTPQSYQSSALDLAACGCGLNNVRPFQGNKGAWPSPPATSHKPKVLSDTRIATVV